MDDEALHAGLPSPILDESNGSNVIKKVVGDRSMLIRVLLGILIGHADGQHRGGENSKNRPTN